MLKRFCVTNSYAVVHKTTECCPTQLLLLKRIIDLVAKKRRCTMVQRNIRFFFRNKGKIATHFAPVLRFLQALFSHVMIFNIPIVSGFIYCLDRIRFSVIRTIAYPNGVRFQLIQINDVLLYEFSFLDLRVQ
ncbi:UNVERIFIED_CONTAM: hypothetical protein NCL1_42784 [Trichonephila clavipes]